MPEGVSDATLDGRVLARSRAQEQDPRQPPAVAPTGEAAELAGPEKDPLSARIDVGRHAFDPYRWPTSSCARV